MPSSVGAALRTKSGESQMNRLSLEACSTSRCSHQIRGLGHIKVDQRSAPGADCVIVAIRLAIVAACCVAKRDFAYQTCLFQKSQRVVNRRVTYRRQKRASLLEHLTRSRMMMTFVHDPKHNSPLRSKPSGFGFLSFGLDCLSGSHRQYLE